MPDSSPRILSTLLCSGCSRPMRSRIVSNPKGRFVGCIASCHTPGCEYSVNVELPYANMQPAKYEAPALPHPSERASGEQKREIG